MIRLHIKTYSNVKNQDYRIHLPLVFIYQSRVWRHWPLSFHDKSAWRLNESALNGLFQLPRSPNSQKAWQAHSRKEPNLFFQLSLLFVLSHRDDEEEGRGDVTGELCFSSLPFWKELIEWVGQELPTPCSNKQAETSLSGSRFCWLAIGYTAHKIAVILRKQKPKQNRLHSELN